MDATRAIQDSIHVFSLVRKYVSRILGTYHIDCLCITTIFTYKPLSLLPVFVLISAMYSCLLSAPVTVNVFTNKKDNQDFVS